MKQLFIFFILLFQVLFSQTRYVSEHSPATRPDGLSWNTAWKDFDGFNINDHEKVPPNTTIKVAPGIYKKGHVNYAASIINIYNNHNITIKKAFPPDGEGGYDPRSHGVEVIIQGNNTLYERGILIQRTGSNQVYGIYLQGLKFENCPRNSVKVRGEPGNPPYYINDIKINGCYFNGNTGTDVLKQNTACIMLQYTSNDTIINSTIMRDLSSVSETDGIYIDDGQTIYIENK
jgi:hypothetical protein